MPHFKTKNKKFVTFETAGLRLTKKEFRQGRERYKRFEESLDNKFKRIRSPLQKKKLPKFDIIGE